MVSGGPSTAFAFDCFGEQAVVCVQFLALKPDVPHLKNRQKELLECFWRHV